MKFTEDQYREIIEHCKSVYLPPTTWCKSVIAKALEEARGDDEE